MKQEGSSISVEMFQQTGLLVTASEADKEEHGEMFLGYKTVLIRALANVMFKSRDIQDMVREEQGIPLVLTCCSIQDQNPCKYFRFYMLNTLDLREWGVFCVRNLCEENAENQQYINNMKAEQLDEKTIELLAQQGFKASIVNNKISLERINPEESSSQPGPSDK